MMDCEEVDDGGAMDRISNLPLHILHHIMSFLTTEDVIRTGALSKAWNSVCASYPNFDFNELRFGFDKSARERVGFVNHVNTTLSKFSQQNVRMRKLRLMFAEPIGPITPLIIEWLLLALGMGVEEVCVCSNLSLYQWHNIPDLDLMPPLKFQFSEKCTRFNSLKKVSLEKVLLDEATFKDLFIVCPLIEDLKLRATSGIVRLLIPKVERLAKVSITFPYKLESINIETDSIRELTLISVRCISLFSLASSFQVLETLRITGCDFEDGLELICPSLKILALEWNRVYGTRFKIDIGTGVKELTLSAPFITLLNLASGFPVLESLRIIDYNLEEGLEIISPTLKILDLEMKRLDFFKVYERIKINTPNLCFFRFCGRGFFICDIIEAPCQWEIELCGIYIRIDYTWFVVLRNVLARAKQITQLNSNSLFYGGISFSLEEAEGTNSPLVSAVEKVCLNCDVTGAHNEPESDDYYLALLDGLLWCCHPKMLLVNSTKEKLTNFIWKQFEGKGDSSLCCGSTLKCWRHVLKEVTWHQTEEDMICFQLTW